MSLLYLIRHAQASFLSEDYDKLSPLGESQAVYLGKYWASQNLSFDRACQGPCLRHKETTDLVRQAYTAVNLNFPEPETLPEFDEYQGEEVLHGSLPALLETDQNIRNLHAAFEAATERQDKRSSF